MRGLTIITRETGHEDDVRLVLVTEVRLAQPPKDVLALCRISIRGREVALLGEEVAVPPRPW